MKITQKPLTMGGPQLAVGYLEIEVDNEIYFTDAEQKPLLYGHPLMVFDDSFGSKVGQTVKKHTIRTGAISETVEEGSNPGHDIIYELASTDPILVAIGREWVKGRLPMGPVDLEDFKT